MSRRCIELIARSEIRRAAAQASDPSASVSSRGLSRQLRDPRIARLIADAFSGVKSPQAVRRPAQRENGRAWSLASDSDRVAGEAKQPLITREDLMREFAAALSRAGKTPDDARDWPALVAQTRISRLEEGTSTSPGRQIQNVAEWCVENERRPDWLVHEEVSGSIYRRRRRTIFECFFDDVKNGRVRDSATGKPITEIACFLLERFTRDPEEGGPWLTLLRQRGINLHETYYRERPRPLHQTEHEIRDAWNRASKEVERNRERIMDALTSLARRGLPTYGHERLIGHEAVLGVVGKRLKTVGYKAIPDQAAALRRAIRQIVDGGSEYAAYCDLREAGFLNSTGTIMSLNSFRRVLRSPRLFGGLRLKTNRERVHGDPDYAGDLYPEELIHEPDETPPPGFVPPIEPIVSYPEWVELQLALERRSKRRGPRTKHLASGYLQCPVPGCGGRHVAGGFAYHCPKKHLEGAKRTAADGPKKIAHDGYRHPTVQLEPADEVISEVLFAVVDAAVTAEDFAPTVDVEALKTQLNEKIRALDARLGDISYMLAEGRIPRSKYDGWCAEIDADRRVLRQELQDVQPPDRIEIPDGLSLRDVWPDMDIERRRHILGLVVERIILHPARDVGALAVATRMEFIFRDGYEPPADEFKELLEELDRKIRRRNAYNRLSGEIEERIWALHEDDLSPSEISRKLLDDGVQPPSGGCWDPSYIIQVLRRVARERDVAFTPNRRDRSNVPYEVRELIVALAKKLRNHNAVARELNRLGIKTAQGKEWTGRTVSATLLVHEKNRTIGRRNATPERLRGLGRPPHLSEAMREQIWKMHRVERMSLAEIARWLKSKGIKTARGNDEWSNASLLYIVRSIDTAKADELAAVVRRAA